MLTTLLLLLGAAHAAPPVDPASDAGLVPGEGVREGPDAVWNGELVGGDRSLRPVVSLFVGARQGNRWAGASFCSGTLVHPEYVVTAAHCVVDAERQTGGGFELYVGVGESFPYERQVRWYGFVAHPDYDKRAGAGAGYDIAVIQLDEALFDEPTMPVQQDRLDTSWIGTDLTIAGFGITRDDRDDAGTKRRTDLPLIRYDRDMMFGFDGSVVYDRRSGMYFEADFDSTTNGCQGDSGGATLAANGQGGFTLVGVNAIVTGGCAGGGLGSTRTDTYFDFLATYIPFDEPTGSSWDEDALYTLPETAEGSLEDAWSDPVRPSGEAGFPTRVACGHVGAGPGAGLAGLLALVVLGQRRRAR